MTRRLYLPLLLALSLTPIYSAAGAQDVEQAIRSQLETFEKAFNSGDGAGVGALYTEDAIAFPPGSPQVEGREAIGKLWQSVINSGVKNLDLEAVEIGAAGQTAYEVGRVALTTPNGQAQGKYIVIWKQSDDGAWRLHRDIWNMNAQ